jgi:hypothetical protein
MAVQPSVNPYQPPKVNLANDHTDNPDWYWRDGKVLVLKQGGQLPPRCIKCNADAQMPMRSKKLAWHHPGWYALILINIIIYAIVGSLASKRVKVEFGLCEEHTAKRRNIIIASWAIFFVSMGTAFFLGQSMENPGVAFMIGILGFLVAVVLGLVGARSIYAKRITEDEVRIAGCGEPFLESTMQRVTF